MLPSASPLRAASKLVATSSGILASWNGAYVMPPFDRHGLALQVLEGFIQPRTVGAEVPP